MLRAFRSTLALAALAFVVFVPAGAFAQDLSPEVIISVGSEKRPYGAISNDYAYQAMQQGWNAYAIHGSENAYYAYYYAYLGWAYGEQAGDVVGWSWSGPFGGITEEEAFEIYFEQRYQQALNDYYSYVYAYLAYAESGQPGWYDAMLNAYIALYYAWVDLSV